ncbi:hypothetical protein [Myxococcus xanthus]|uniref:hypothetical protein n=1 Tax=Myxococcus xanthus TaxID=34 RepID=UPI0020A2AD7C|nr:hypothetical protein [Myxococcus xanthus]
MMIANEPATFRPASATTRCRASSSSEVIELLLTGAADARLRNADGESAADRARQQGHTKLAERLS